MEKELQRLRDIRVKMEGARQGVGNLLEDWQFSRSELWVKLQFMAFIQEADKTYILLNEMIEDMVEAEETDKKPPN